ncbi:F-box/kelch-repeat protein At1g57790-like [Tripterygium wilfordii]|uniref:F-box/kelch-repeat protein At1g57790-like n=1 Tax=Tripterygium wilfordii TaxID=458696 RepID=UPI0018F834AB|nr:F-box/kelch-repeat protein At1g57790-like [Tripterygium wilfordii]
MGGIRGGFMYYFWKNYLFTYNFAENSVSVSSPHAVWNIPDSCYPPIPYTSHIRLIYHRDVGKNSVEARQSQTNNDNNVAVLEKNDGEDPFGCLPIDLLKIIIRFLHNNVVDYMNFRAVSRSCESAAPRIQWREAPISLKSAPLLPWLMSSDNSHPGTHSFVDSKLGGKYLVKIPESLVDAKILYSRKGWLLMHNIAMESLSFYNPLTKNIIRLPHDLAQAIVLFSSMGFSDFSPKCYVVVAIHALDETKVHVFWYGSLFRFNNDRDKFVTNHTSPVVFYDGGFYVLGRDGNLGIFVVLGPQRHTWKVLDKP